ncbi:MAG: hypothetical protein FP810_18420 [Desulfocapsa sp.]|nr:hypothetical protein [Desulfocapsa sp.]
MGCSARGTAVVMAVSHRRQRQGSGCIDCCRNPGYGSGQARLIRGHGPVAVFGHNPAPGEHAAVLPEGCAPDDGRMGPVDDLYI